MIFLSVEFFILMIVLLLLLSVFTKRAQWQVLLLIASYVFYAYSDWRFLLLIVFETIVVYFAQYHLGKENARFRRGVLAATVGVLLCILGVFKYFDFFIGSICTAFQIEHAFSLQLILPLGISFFTFQALSIVFDVYYKKTDAEKNPVLIALGICFFPLISCGPIVEARRLLPQFKAEHRICWNNIVNGLQIVTVGIIKKKVIADRLGVAVDAVYENPAVYDWSTLALIAVTYSIQIYCDFSGYSDMAIGIARMLDFDLGRNFNLPYMAKNTSEFWRRWHISLSTWFKDYVYIPLGGSRKGRVRTYVNLFLVMFLSGLWHGAGWQFLFWGAAYGICNILHKMFRELIERNHWQFLDEKRSLKVLSVCLNFVVVTILWIFFRAESIGEAGLILSRIFTLAGGVSYHYVYTYIFVLLTGAIGLYKYHVYKGEDRYLQMDLGTFWGKFIWILLLLLIVCFEYVGGNAFIYAQF